MKQEERKQENEVEHLVEPKEFLKKFSEQDKKFWMTDALKKATPVAKRWAYYQMKEKHKKFPDFEEMFIEICCVESDLYCGLRQNLLKHIGRHGLGSKGLSFMQMFEDVDDFNVHKYEAVLRQIRKAFAHNSREVENLKKQIETTHDYNVLKQRRNKLADLVDESDDFEYLISKINEFLKKMHDLGAQGYALLMEEKTPDLSVWKTQKVLNDLLFEENKQFLKQSLHHIETLRECQKELGVAEIRLLLYHKDGCRRQKLQKMVEEDVIAIFNQLKSEDERLEVYPEICDFVSQIVPAVGYISPLMISFIFDRGFVSSISRDLLLNIKPIISGLNMTPLLEIPLQRYLEDTMKHLIEGYLNETDEYVLELTQAYMPKALSETSLLNWEKIKNLRENA